MNFEASADLWRANREAVRNVKRDPSATYAMPTDAEIEALQVGDLAIDPWGKQARVTRIFARGRDINGRAYVCYYTESGPRSEIMHSMMAGELVRTLEITRLHNSAELDEIERCMRQDLETN